MLCKLDSSKFAHSFRTKPNPTLRGEAEKRGADAQETGTL